MKFFSSKYYDVSCWRVRASEHPNPTASADYIADVNWLAWSGWFEFALSAAPVSEVVYDYNSLGQVKSIGTPANPTRFAAYSYNADGGLASEQLNNGNPSFNCAEKSTE